MVVFKDDASRASYAARRVRGRPLMERAEYAELITSRPYLHELILVDADNDYAPAWPVDRSMLDEEWREMAIPVVRSKMRFSDEQIAEAKRAVIGGGESRSTFYAMKRAYSAQISIDMPTLAWLFEEGAEKKFSVAEILVGVEGKLREWGSAMGR